MIVVFFQLDSELATKKAEYQKMVAASNQKIEEIKVDLAKWEKTRPFEEMTREELVAHMPDQKLFTDVRKEKFVEQGDKEFDEWAAEARELTKHRKWPGVDH